MTTQTKRGWAAVAGWWIGILLACGLATQVRAVDLELATLNSGTDVFTNVTVYGQTETDLFIKHSRGFGNVKISSLDKATLRALKLGGGSAEDESGGVVAGKAAATVANLKARFAEAQLTAPSQSEVIDLIARYQPNRNLVIGVVAVAAIGYLLLCICFKLICLNAGSKPGMLIWFPGLQMFPLLRAAKMSGWWFLAFLIPLVGVVAHIIWCVKIAKACGKGGLVAVLLILPGTNLFAFLYLAFAKSNVKSADEAPPLRGQTLAMGSA